jgi:type III secretion system FlhB-like substrate exporter
MHTNERRKLIGLEYERERDTAPRVSLKTTDQVTYREVLRLAKKYNVPVMEKPEDVSLLFSTPVDKVIPEKLYNIVAVILKTIGM